MSDPAAKPRPRPNWCGNYSVLLNGSPIATIVLTREWIAGIPKHTATLGDGRSVTRSDAAFAVYEALKLIAPGEPTRPWYLGCDERGLRLRAEGRAPWDPPLAEETPAQSNKTAPSRHDLDPVTGVAAAAASEGRREPPGRGNRMQQSARALEVRCG